MGAGLWRAWSLGGPARPRTTGGLKEGRGRGGGKTVVERGPEAPEDQCSGLLSTSSASTSSPCLATWRRYRATAAHGRYIQPRPACPPYIWMVQVQRRRRRLCVFARAGCRSSIAVVSVAGCRGPIFPSEWMMRSSKSSLRSLASQQMALARPLGVPAEKLEAMAVAGRSCRARRSRLPGSPGMEGNMTSPDHAMHGTEVLFLWHALRSSVPMYVHTHTLRHVSRSRPFRRRIPRAARAREVVDAFV